VRVSVNDGLTVAEAGAFAVGAVRTHHTELSPAARALGPRVVGEAQLPVVAPDGAVAVAVHPAADVAAQARTVISDASVVAAAVFVGASATVTAADAATFPGFRKVTAAVTDDDRSAKVVPRPSTPPTAALSLPSVAV
jgi:hypothetical protein